MKFLVATLLFGSSLAQAAETCSALDGLKQAVLTQNQISSIPLAPALSYNGLTVGQVSSAGASDYLNRLSSKFASAAKAFIEAGGAIEPAAHAALGDANRRQALDIYKHADASTPSSPDASCGSGSCIDMAMGVSAMHLVTGKSAQQVMESISSAKLASIKPAVVYYCVTANDCVRKAQIAPGNSKVRNSAGGEAMRVGQYYTVREVAKSIAGTIDNTSVFKVSSFDICGHQAYLMSGVSIRDANSFSSASQDVLVVEAGGRVMTIAAAQGIGQKGSSVQNIFLGGFLVGKIARSTVVGGYNEESARLGTSEEIDKNGFLK